MRWKTGEKGEDDKCRPQMQMQVDLLLNLWRSIYIQQMQVDLSATGDKLPNAVVAFLTCEVLSPPASSVQIHFLDEAPELNTLQPGFFIMTH